jgi:hypothetical protein
MPQEITSFLTGEEVLTSHTFRPAVKIAPTLIRPMTQQDVEAMGASFLDLEGRAQRVEIGRFLCVGIEGERWTCSANSLAERIAIGTPDAEGFVPYLMRHPHVVLVTIVSEPFRLLVGDDTWESRDNGGVITWNGKRGDELMMRVIQGRIFDRTYQLLGEKHGVQQQNTSCKGGSNRDRLSLQAKSDHEIAERYCAELLKLKTLNRFGRHSERFLGYPNTAMMNRCRFELQHRGLSIPQVIVPEQQA